MHHEEREGTLESRHDVAQSRGQVGDPIVFTTDQEGCDLGVRLTDKRRSGDFELSLEFSKILDDPIVDQGQFPVGRKVRVGVAVGGPTVSRPAGVADTGHPISQRLVLQIVEQHLQLSRALASAEVARLVDDRDARRIVASVLQPLQAAEQHLDALAVATDFIPDITNDSAHVSRF